MHRLRLKMSVFAGLSSLCLLSQRGVLADAAPAGGGARSVQSFDGNWRFLNGSLTGAEKTDFDDSGWKTVDVPHDWSIAGPFDQNARTGRGGGFLPSGVGWYRKHFTTT